MEKTDFPYKFCAGEPGIFVEIYLPKKAKFQGTLYDSLTKAISTPKILKKYFTRNKSEILKLMKEDYPKLAQNYNEIVNTMPYNIFLGY